MTQRPRYDVTGRLGITQIVDGVRLTLVVPAPLIGGPGPITADGVAQIAAGWGDEIQTLIDRWQADFDDGQQAVALAKAEARELETLMQLAAELQADPRNLEILRELMRRLSDGDDAVSVAVATALIDARDEAGEIAESAADFTERAAEELRQITRAVADAASTVVKVSLFAAAAWGASRLIRAVRT